MTSDPQALRGKTPVLRLRNVVRRFGSWTALEDVNLDLAGGERLALLGPNGAGKTTLVRCVSGRVVVDDGSIELFGSSLSPTAPRPDLGFVPQELALYTDLTARENLEAFARFLGLSGSTLKRAVDWGLAWTGLLDRADDLVSTFSGGMKRRVNIACGVLHQPRVLLLDEPTVGVDPQSRERIFAMLDELSSLGTAVLLTTHQLEEAARQCDRIVIIDRGRVIADGTVGDLIRRTVGDNRRVALTLATPGPLPDGFEATDHPSTVVTEVADVAEELPELLRRVRESGGRVSDISVASPSLHDVFIHLTGRELRE